MTQISVQLINFIAGELDDESLDAIEIHRQYRPTHGLANEPVTAAATVLLTSQFVPVVARIIERWLENQRQLEQIRVVASGFDHSDAAGNALAELGKVNAKVSIEYRLPAHSGANK